MRFSTTWARAATTRRVGETPWKQHNVDSNYLEDGETAAEPLLGEQVALARDLRLLGRTQPFQVGNHLQRRVLVLQLLLFGFQFLALLHVRPATRTKEKTESVNTVVDMLDTGNRFQECPAVVPRQDVLEGRRLEKVADLLLRHGLFDEQAEDERVAELAKVVEELGARVRILDDVVQLGLRVPKDETRR